MNADVPHLSGDLGVTGLYLLGAQLVQTVRQPPPQRGPSKPISSLLLVVPRGPGGRPRFFIPTSAT